MLRLCSLRLRKVRLHRVLALVLAVAILMVVFINVDEVRKMTKPSVMGDAENDMGPAKDSSLSKHQDGGKLPRARHGNPLNFQDEECEMCDDSMVVDKDMLAVNPLVRSLGQDKIQLFRHYTGAEPWPQVQLDSKLPGQVPTTAHYLWCKGARFFGFHHYLGLLSIIRHMQPIKLVFHHQRPLRLDHDMYYSWFMELKQSLPGLVFHQLPENSPPCGSSAMLEMALTFIQQDGGVLLGSNVILARPPRDFDHHSFWFHYCGEQPSGIQGQLPDQDVTRLIAIANRGFSDDVRRQHVQEILKQTTPDCVSPVQFDSLPPDSANNARCVTFPDDPHIYPVDIMYANTSFGQLSRWLYYGTRRLMIPRTKVGDPIPRISHMIWFSPHRFDRYNMEFYQFLTILSALYVGGFHHVYIHGNAGFQGQWWQMLENENVTFVHMDEPEMIFQQEVRNPSHKSDVTRYSILHKYGGAYQDFEAMWTARVPDWLLDYPCVATSDWAAYGDFPDGINPGVLLAKRHAPWLRYNMGAHRYYIENNFVWNAVLMSYRTYERHPDQLLFYRHLQVMCDNGICHPSWEPGFRRDINDRRPTIKFDWQTETLVVHVTRPDPEQSFISPESLKVGNDMFADIGRNILKKSGRMNILSF